MNQENIRNFCIISHIDHGKSTLADRFLELTGTISPQKMHEQFLDLHPLERERGITIKLQPVRMDYKDFALNLVDTPGHVDFSYEVSRSLAAVEGAVLLVDATKGVQAQTIANYKFAKDQNLKIIPAINKIDLANARIDEVKKEMRQVIEGDYTDIIKISAKSGEGTQELLQEIIKKIEPPKGTESKNLKALVFDSLYDPYKGVVAYVRIFDGSIKSGQKIKFFAQKAEAEVLEVGHFKPDLVKSQSLGAGEIGYVATGLKDISMVRVGDTITNFQKIPGEKFEPLPGYHEPKPVVFMSLFPKSQDDYDLLKDSLSKLELQDAALFFEPESSLALGRGFRCGFLGMLHAEIVSERLRRDYKLNLIISSPSVEYKIKPNKGPIFFIRSANELPDPNKIQSIEEPIAELEIVSSQNYLGQIMKLMNEYRSKYLTTDYLGSEAIILRYRIPLAEIIVDFYDRLKSISSGYASMNYKIIGFESANLIKLDILIAGEKIEPFSRIVPEEKSYQEGKRLVEKLKDIFPPQLFVVPLQAAVGSKILARETIKAKKKDVTGYLYGGDITRKMKLWKKQKRGKERLKERSKVNIPQEVFLEILKK